MLCVCMLCMVYVLCMYECNGSPYYAYPSPASITIYSRFLFPNHETIDALDLTTCKRAVRAQLNPANVEVSMAGDLPLESMEELVLTYLGTVPQVTKLDLADSATRTSYSASTTSTGSSTSYSQHLTEYASVGGNTPSLPPQSPQHLEVFLPDSEERAMGYLSGPAPNRWGVFADGQSIVDKVAHYTGNKEVGRWKNPLFGYAALQILQEVCILYSGIVLIYTLYNVVYNLSLMFTMYCIYHYSHLYIIQ